MRKSIKEIAAEAGVSIATVSKVINNKMYVSETTRNKVLAIVNKYNYSPSPSAVSLATSMPKIVYFADRFSKGMPYKNPHMFDIICGVSKELTRKGYLLQLLNLDHPQEETDAVLINAITSKGASGIIINEMYVTPTLENFVVSQNYPLLCIGAPKYNSLLSWIDVNHALSSSIAVDYLIRTDCKHIAYMGGEQSDHIFEWRLQGFLDAAKKNQLSVPDNYIVYNTPDIESITRKARNLLSLPQRPDAIVCTNSLMLAGTMQAAKEMNLHLPDDISLIGFDDYPFGPMLYPAPTIIDIDMYSLGTTTASTIIKKIKKPSLLIQTYTALPNLIIRDTTKKM